MPTAMPASGDKLGFGITGGLRMPPPSRRAGRWRGERRTPGGTAGADHSRAGKRPHFDRPVQRYLRAKLGHVGAKEVPPVVWQTHPLPSSKSSVRGARHGPQSAGLSLRAESPLRG
jgi:hypothetical protein